MDPIIEATAATSIAGIVVALYKHAQPKSLSWTLVLVALAAGIGSAFLISLAGGLVLNVQSVSQTVIQGIIAAAAAAGISRTDAAAEAKRPGGSKELEEDLEQARRL